MDIYIYIYIYPARSARSACSATASPSPSPCRARYTLPRPRSRPHSRMSPLHSRSRPLYTPGHVPAGHAPFVVRVSGHAPRCTPMAHVWSRPLVVSCPATSLASRILSRTSVASYGHVPRSRPTVTYLGHVRRGAATAPGVSPARPHAGRAAAAHRHVPRLMGWWPARPAGSPEPPVGTAQDSDGGR
jgi:hypothetical protein